MIADGFTTTEVGEYFTDLSSTSALIDKSAVCRAADLLSACLREGNRLYIAGNGGSASTASHITVDLMKTVSGPRVGGALRGFGAVCLTDNSAVMTAIANDFGYEHTLSEQIGTLGRTGDLVMLISVSGTSPNIVAAAHTAKRLEMPVIALTGKDGGDIASLSDVHVNVPSADYGVVEDLHLSIGHLLTRMFRQRLVGGTDG